MKDLYDVAWKLAERYLQTDKPVKDKQGRPLITVLEQLSSWTEHFSKLYLKTPQTYHPQKHLCQSTLKSPPERRSGMLLRNWKMGKHLAQTTYQWKGWKHTWTHPMIFSSASLRGYGRKKNFLTTGTKASSSSCQRKGTQEIAKTTEKLCYCLSLAKFSTGFSSSEYEDNNWL